MNSSYENDEKHAFNTPDSHIIPNSNGYLSNFILAKLPENLLNWVEKNGSDLVTICDRNGIILHVSNSIERILGYKAEEVESTSSLEYIYPNDLGILKEKFVFDSNKVQKFNLGLRNVYGKYVWVECLISRIQEETDIDQYVSVTKDITDKKEAEEMMIRSEKMSVAGQLAAGVAHEIRNPLTSLKGFLQLLHAGMDRKEEYYKIMVDEIEKIETITSELLFVSKPMTEDKKWECLSQMLNDVVTLLYSQAKLFNVEIQVAVKEDVEICCDRSQIKQVFINLIKNAVEEMKDGGTIKVESNQNIHEHFIDIVDEGPGIPENIIHKLKEPFFTTKKEGTGLGLMISSQILERHNGRLDILQNHTKGSTFRVVLPVEHQ